MVFSDRKKKEVVFRKRFKTIFKIEGSSSFVNLLHKIVLIFQQNSSNETAKHMVAKKEELILLDKFLNKCAEKFRTRFFSFIQVRL